MNDIMHDHLNKLRIISKIREGQSLNTRNGQFSVYEPSIANWIWRKLAGDDKDEVVRCLQDFYRSLDQTVEQLIGEIKGETQDTARKNRLAYVAINLAEKIRSSIKGIECLSKTYTSYTKTTSTLEGIVQDFAIVTYKQLLDVIPVDKMTKVLRERVTYNDIILYDGATNISPLLLAQKETDHKEEY